MKIFEKYNIIARIFPTILGLIPLFVFQYFFLNNFIGIDSIILSVVGNFSLSTILIYTCSQYFVRIPSKLYEDWLFKKQLHFPTTNFLMYSNDEYTDDFKDEIRKSIKSDFSISLLGKKAEKENDSEARKKINEAIRVVIGKVKDGHLVLQHNIEYGFVRNLWGASLVGTLGSILLITYSPSRNLLNNLGLFFVVLFILYLLFGFVIIQYFGRAYSKKLIEEYYKLSHEN